MTAGRDKLIRFYKGTEGEETVIRLVDLAEQAVRTQKFRLSGFLDPYGAEIAETVAANYDGLTVGFDGGYPGAERQRAAFAMKILAAVLIFPSQRCGWNGMMPFYASHTEMYWALSWALAWIGRRRGIF